MSMSSICGLMWDSTTPEVIPSYALLRALYVTGRGAVRPAFGRGRVYIDVLGNAPQLAFWADVETGDITPDHFAGWLDRRHAAGAGWGGGYCNRATLPAMVSAAGRRPWSLWLATLDGHADPAVIAELASLPPNVTLVAVQAFPAAMTGGNADLSVVVSRAWWAGRALSAPA